MHVCFVFHREYPQNYSTAMNEYTEKLSEYGVDVSVIAARNSRDKNHHEYINGIEVYRILSDTSTSVSIEPTIFAYKAFNKLDELCRKDNIDILHMISFPNLGAILKPLPWQKRPECIIGDVRGTAVSNSLFDYISRKGMKIQRELIDEMVVIDEKVSENVFGDNKNHILPLGVDFKKFHPGENTSLRNKWGIDENEMVFGYIGNLHTSRELGRLINSFEKLNNEYTKTKLLIVGGGSDLKNLKYQTNQLDLEDDVILTGRVQYSDVPKYIHTFDIGLSYIPDKPQYRDQPPLKTVEFLASGLPVIATDTPGNQRFITNDKNGILIPDTTDQYKEAMEDLLINTDKRKKIAMGARESICEYSYRNIIENNLIPFYKKQIS